jgi:hypothetical protein
VLIRCKASSFLANWGNKRPGALFPRMLADLASIITYLMPWIVIKTIQLLSFLR